jgi:hypothetical protein
VDGWMHASLCTFHVVIDVGRVQKVQRRMMTRTGTPAAAVLSSIVLVNGAKRTRGP